jgi:hypothetical protein
MTQSKRLPKHTALSVRLADDILKELDKLRITLATPGLTLCRVDVLRVALVRGIEVLKKEMPRAASR